jgi:hypothetical protein
LEREQYYLNNINPSLNICKLAGSPLGIKHGISFSKNLSKARRGKKNNVNNINTMSRITTYETRLKLSYRSSGIKVKIFDESNNLINEFPTMMSAAKFIGVSDRTISRIYNTGISYDNYTYKFELRTEKPIIVSNKENNITQEYSSVRAAAEGMAVSRWVVRDYLNTNKLFKGVYLIYR